MIRIGSFALRSPAVSGSPRVSLARNDSLSSVFSGERSTVGSPMISLHFDVNRRRDKVIRRSLSESDVLQSASDGFRALPASYAGKLAGSGISTEELVPGGGDCGGNTVTVQEGEQRKIGVYYQEMLKSNPGDPLLLRNYGKFLHEVEKDAVGAEECYCRAILGSPGDGDLLSLYGKLIWETQRDEERAKSYFDQAVSASPDDCMVLGSFASFMWEAEEDEDEDDNEEINIDDGNQASSVPALVPAF
ncbi:hypothetical protein D8674_028510 [Pyrus ussuriensis x Pyrus communis]|uniref:Uncharacterized protein n=1 Tax=Pyrus ussuriensis x Pyrus communis TaxID=2448454 RepID=A0A5N5HZH0_9ROSA|nr:hypothetical protein D8674_028510 [Pyrus ussuriensis x Pyrus communis]